MSPFEQMSPDERNQKVRAARVFRTPSKLLGRKIVYGPCPDSIDRRVWALLNPDQQRQILIMLDADLQKRVRIMEKFFVSSATAKRDLAAVRRANSG